jgi:hypothetical protein
MGGSEFTIKECPKCLNNKNKLYINSSKKTWFCQRCAWGKGIGDITILMAEVSGRNLHDVRVELLQTVVPATSSDDYLNSLGRAFGEVTSSDDDDLLKDLILPTEPPGTQDWGSFVGKQVLSYAKKRGLDEELLKFISCRVATSLNNRTGPFLVFPVIFNGMTVSWQGRRINSGNPKYISHTNIGEWIWPCSSNYIESLKEKGSTVLVEGVFDALGCISAGVAAQCTFGKNITNKQLKLLVSQGIKTVYLGWDPGTYQDIVKAVDMLSPMFDVKILNIEPVGDSDKTDPGDVLTDRSLIPWITDAYENAMDAHSPAYNKWRLTKEFK